MSDVEGDSGAHDGNAGMPFDESFVSGARYHEPSARDRARWVKGARRVKRRNSKARREASLRGLRARLLPWGILAAITLVYWWSGK